MEVKMDKMWVKFNLLSDLGEVRGEIEAESQDDAAEKLETLFFEGAPIGWSMSVEQSNERK